MLWGNEINFSKMGEECMWER